ncbi:uncharacterized protein LOC110269635 [Arachis ipaensis]|uniref:uncharacterized protein LOC110269635 n=1 Tax=Arachis ipaensis TaxID=130454 RepID=UPI000A2B0705|nr:uncharacterized protein LOC110269635 [Arachis ipaensis]
MNTERSTTYNATGKKMEIELGCKPRQSEVFQRMHTRKDDRTKLSLTFDWPRPKKRVRLRLHKGPEPPPIYKDEIWMQTVGSRKRNRDYGMGYQSIMTSLRFFDVEFTTSGGVDIRELVTLLNRELQQDME